MVSILQRLRAKQQADAEKREIRLAKQRGYGVAARARAKQQQQSGLDDLPLEVAAAIEQLKPPSKPEEAKSADASVEELVSRLGAIREHIWRLQAVFAVSLSHDSAVKADRYLQLFHALAAELKIKDAAALDQLVAGHESLLLSPTVPVRQTIPIETQRFVELRWEASQAPIRRAPKRSADCVGDGQGGCCKKIWATLFPLWK
jgi:hypothetical protein